MGLGTRSTLFDLVQQDSRGESIPKSLIRAHSYLHSCRCSSRHIDSIRATTSTVLLLMYSKRSLVKKKPIVFAISNRARSLKVYGIKPQILELNPCPPVPTTSLSQRRIVICCTTSLMRWKMQCCFQRSP